MQRSDGGKEGAGSESGGGHLQVQFQAEPLEDLVALVGRLFYDDACIVLLDYLAHNRYLFTESELREQLGWRDALVQQKLYVLHKHMLVEPDVPVMATGGRRGIGPKWRLSPHIYSAVQWRFQALLDRLSSLVEEVTMQREFACSRPTCEEQYSVLEAASCPRSLEDEHPLCTLCGAKLKPSEYEEAKHQAKEKRAKALLLFEPLSAALARIALMKIPPFPPFAQKEALAEKAAAEAAAAEEEALAGSDDAVSTLTQDGLASSALVSGDGGAREAPGSGGGGGHTTPAIRVGLNRPPGAVGSTAIPWFAMEDRARAPSQRTAAQPNRGPLPVGAPAGAAHAPSPYQYLPPPAAKAGASVPTAAPAASAIAAPTANPGVHGISFGLRRSAAPAALPVVQQRVDRLANPTR